MGKLKSSKVREILEGFLVTGMEHWRKRPFRSNSWSVACNSHTLVAYKGSGGIEMDDCPDIKLLGSTRFDGSFYGSIKTTKDHMQEWIRDSIGPKVTESHQEMDVDSTNWGVVQGIKLDLVKLFYFIDRLPVRDIELWPAPNANPVSIELVCDGPHYYWRAIIAGIDTTEDCPNVYRPPPDPYELIGTLDSGECPEHIPSLSEILASLPSE